MPPLSSSSSTKLIQPQLSAGFNDRKYRTARPEDEEEIANAFDVFDIGSKDYLTYYEFKSAIKGLGFDLPAKDLKLVFSGRGVELEEGRGIKKAEFISFGRRLYEYQPLKEKLATIFDLIDTTKRGSLGIADLRRAATFADLQLEDRDLKGMIDAFDLQGNGTINFDDFCTLCDEDLFEEISFSNEI